MKATKKVSQDTCSIPEAGARLGLGRDASYQAAARGQMPVLEFGHRKRVPIPLLEAMLRGEWTPTVKPEGAA